MHDSGMIIMMVAGCDVDDMYTYVFLTTRIEDIRMYVQYLLLSNEDENLHTLETG